MNQAERGRIAGEQERICADVWLMSKIATGLCLVGEETHAFGLIKKKNVIYSQIYCRREENFVFNDRS
jgi:hypothetical protein